ncbi:G-protein coupled receptor 26 [Tachysurus ichikawai]
MVISPGDMVLTGRLMKMRYIRTVKLLELWPAVPINQHWGVLCKCLAYSKAACDPFVYSLLRHQYRKACTDIINRILKRRSMNSADEWQRAQGPNTVVQAMELPGTLKECTA